MYCMWDRKDNSPIILNDDHLRSLSNIPVILTAGRLRRSKGRRATIATLKDGSWISSPDTVALSSHLLVSSDGGVELTDLGDGIVIDTVALSVAIALGQALLNAWLSAGSKDWIAWLKA